MVVWGIGDMSNSDKINGEILANTSDVKEDTSAKLGNSFIGCLFDFGVLVTNAEIPAPTA